MNGREADYVIVGAGSAGCVLAHRLSHAGATVLLLEAGGADWDPLIHIPLGIGVMHERRSHDWGYDTEPEPGLSGRAIEAMRGKVVGGSSSINHMSWVRGNPGDYDRWASAGLEGWAYRDVLPYFRRSETWEEGATGYRGGDGPLRVIRSRSKDPLFDAYLDAARALGFPFNEDHNGPQQDGIARGQTTIWGGRRQSHAVAFLRPALVTGRVHVLTGSHATRLIFSGQRVEGVEYVRRGKVHRAYAGCEVILSAGTFNSPQLLMLSGVGPAEHLHEHGIDVRLNLPGVGHNLQDHIAAIVTAVRPIPGPFVRELRADRMPLSMVRAHLYGRGPATVLPGGMHGYIRTRVGFDVPDIQFLFRGVSIKPHLWFPGVRRPARDHCGVRPVLLHPESRGTVTLQSADPFEKVRIQQNFFAVEADLATLREGVQIARDLLSQAPMNAFRGDEVAPGKAKRTHQDVDEWIRRTALTAHHPAGTCAMGTGDMAVLDGEMRVRGLEGLRVIDASAMPDLVSGNINACVTMIAEKASDLLLGRSRLSVPEASAALQAEPV